MRSGISLAAFLFVLAVSAPAEKPSPSPEKKAKAGKAERTAKASPSPKKDASDEEAPLAMPGIVGVPVKGLKIPYRNQEGKEIMNLEADIATKLDESRVEFQNLKVDAVDEDGSKFVIEVPTSIFNLETRILKSDSRVLIRRSDFEIIGDAVEFNTKTRYGKITGNVKMTILSSDKIEE